MHLLPLNLAKIVDQTDSKNSTRFTLSAVHLRLMGDNTFIAEATDSKQLIRVTGNCVGDVSEYPEHAGMKAAPNGSLEALVPGESWKAAFSMANKLAKKNRKPLLNSVAVKLGKDTATFGATNLDSYPVEQTRLVDGRFPPTGDILGRAQKKGEFVFAADPKLLAGLLNTMASFAGEDNKRVEFFIEDSNKPILIRHVGSELKAEGILMPLCPPNGEEGDAEETEEDTTIADLREQVEMLKREKGKLEAANAKLRETLEGREVLQAVERFTPRLSRRERLGV